MKIGNQRVHRLKSVAGVYKNPRVALHGRNRAVLARHTFNGSTGRGADTDQASTARPSFVDDTCAFLRNREEFGMHHVLGDAIRLDRTEGAKTNVQHDGGNRDPLFSNLFQQLVGKMQSGSGSRRRPLFTRINRLVAVIVLELFGNIWRQRHHANAMQNIVNIIVTLLIVKKTNDAIALLYKLQHLSRQHTVTKHKAHTHAGALSGLYQHLPSIQCALAKKQQLNSRALASLYVSVKTCGNDLGIIYDQHVIRLQII